MTGPLFWLAAILLAYRMGTTGDRRLARQIRRDRRWARRHRIRGL